MRSVRRRLQVEETPESARHDRATRVLVRFNALAGSVASLIALYAHAAGPISREALATAAAVALLGPTLLRDRPGEPGRAPRPPRRALLVSVVLAQVFAIAFIAAFAPVGLLPASLLAVQGHLLRRLDADLPAGGSLALGAAQGLVAFVIYPRGVTLLAFVIAFVGAIVGGVLVHGRAARRSVGRAIGDAALVRPSPGALGARMRYAITLALVVLVWTFVIDGTARGVSRWWQSLRSGGDAAGIERRGAGALGAPAAYGSARPGNEETTQSFSDSLEYDQPFVGSGDQLLARVKPVRGHRAGSGLYLRGVVLDTFTATGLRAGAGTASRTVRDADDGMTDGWSVLEPTRRAPREVAVQQVPLRFGRATQGTVLLTLEPAQAVEVSPVRYDPDRALEDVRTRQGWFEYGLRAGPEPPRMMLSAAATTHPDTRYTALPPGGGPALSRLTDLVERVTTGAPNDLERVNAVIGHFAKDYEYTAEAPAGRGLEALESLLDMQRGYCVQYASAAALMLRSQGIPCRVVQGFLATEWIAVEQLYDVYPPDVHAWLEVHFQGYGWVPFDPTPSDARLAVVRDPSGGGDDWGQEAARLFDAWAAGRMISLDDLARLLARGPGALVRNLGRGRLLIAALILLAIGIWLVLPSRRRSAKATDADTAARREAVEHYTRILHELARLGHRKRPAQTPREFATAVATLRDQQLDPLGPLTERLYAARYGERPLDVSDVAAIDAFVAALRGRQRVVR